MLIYVRNGSQENHLTYRDVTSLPDIYTKKHKISNGSCIVHYCTSLVYFYQKSIYRKWNIIIMMMTGRDAPSDESSRTLGDIQW